MIGCAQAQFAIFQLHSPVVTGDLLLESADFLLLENGDKLALE